MYYLLGGISGKWWWYFAKNGEITDWNELPFIGKICYKVFIFTIKRITGAKTEEEIALLTQKLVEEKGLS